MNPTCETCRFWLEYEEQDESDRENQYGECVRFPPQHKHGEHVSRFPTSFAYSWCGEHQPRPDEPGGAEK